MNPNTYTNVPVPGELWMLRGTIANHAMALVTEVTESYAAAVAVTTDFSLAHASGAIIPAACAPFETDLLVMAGTPSRLDLSAFGGRAATVCSPDEVLALIRAMDNPYGEPAVLPILSAADAARLRFRAVADFNTRFALLADATLPTDGGHVS